MSTKLRDLSISSAVLLASLFCAAGSHAQTPSPSPDGSAESSVGGYEVTSSIELGVRGLEVNGDHNKYRSDLNYRAGFRVFDSSFTIENKSAGTKYFDTAQVTTTGFGSDPSGSFRFSMDRIGFYKFDSNIRRVKYFNFLNNHAAPEPFIGGIPRGQHNFNTAHNFGDLDLTIFPERDNLRFRLGYSFNKTKGNGTYTTRFQSDEYEIGSNVDTGSQDFRAGIDGKLLGFNLGLTYGRRLFEDDTSYSQGPSLGNTITNNSRITFFDRRYPIEGDTNFVHFNAQRTFGRKLDFTGRFIYSISLIFING